MQLTEAIKRKCLMMPLTLSLTMIAGCSTLTSKSATYPANLEVVITNDDWVCLSPESARRLSEFRADLEAI